MEEKKDIYYGCHGCHGCGEEVIPVKDENGVLRCPECIGINLVPLG